MTLNRLVDYAIYGSKSLIIQRVRPICQLTARCAFSNRCVVLVHVRPPADVSPFNTWIRDMSQPKRAQFQAGQSNLVSLCDGGREVRINRIVRYKRALWRYTRPLRLTISLMLFRVENYGANRNAAHWLTWCIRWNIYSTVSHSDNEAV